MDISSISRTEPWSSRSAWWSAPSRLRGSPMPSRSCMTNFRGAASSSCSPRRRTTRPSMPAMCRTGCPRSPAVTEYDVLLRLLAARSVPTLDLRPALRAENATRATYFRTDTHWNFLGALVARNEMVRAIGHPEWAMAIDHVFRGMKTTYGERDLPRILGVRNAPDDQHAVVDVSSYPDADGPTVLIIGDSFINQFFPMIWRNGGRFAFLQYTL